MKLKTHFSKTIIALVGFVFLATTALQVNAASTWRPPTQSAPGGNVDTPVNTGRNFQEKLGALFLNTSLTDPFEIGLSVFGRAIFNGNVQIATGSPAAGKVLTALDSNGTVGWGVAAAPACTTTDVPLGTYSISMNSGNNAATNQLLVGGLTADTYKIRGNGSWSSVGGGGAVGIYYNISSTWPTIPGAPAGATSPGIPAVYLYNAGQNVIYVQHYGADSGTWTAGNGSNENTFTTTQTQNLYAAAGQSAMSGSVSLYRVVSSCGGSPSTVSTSGVSRIIAGAGVTVSPAAGTGDVTVDITPGINLSDIRASLEYVSCTGGGSASSASCSASCSVGKKIVGGGCTASFRSGGISGGSGGSLAPNTSAPNAGHDAWVCAAGPVMSNTSASVAGNAICM